MLKKTTAAILLALTLTGTLLSVPANATSSNSSRSEDKSYTNDSKDTFYADTFNEKILFIDAAKEQLFNPDIEAIREWFGDDWNEKYKDTAPRGDSKLDWSPIFVSYCLEKAGVQKLKTIAVNSEDIIRKFYQPDPMTTKAAPGDITLIHGHMGVVVSSGEDTIRIITTEDTRSEDTGKWEENIVVKTISSDNPDLIIGSARISD